MANHQPRRTSVHFERYKPVNDFLESKNKRDQRLWTIKGEGILCTVYEGREISASDFNKLHPLKNPVNFNHSPENSDGTKSWMQ
jgi:hypothetical protein